MSLDLTLYSLYRLNGQDLPNLPGLLSAMPPRKTARGRERESLIISLVLSGNTEFDAAEYLQLTGAAANAFYSASGALTSALRVAAESVNRSLLDRNLTTTGRGQYVIGALILAALRETQLTLLQCGPTYAAAFLSGQARRYHDPALSGKGLGLHPTFTPYYAQVALQPGHRLLLCIMRSVPSAWENALAADHGLHPAEETRKRLLALEEGDLNAALINVTEGKGLVTIARPSTVSHPARATHAPRPTPPPDSASPKPAPAAPVPSVPAPSSPAPSASPLDRLPRIPGAPPSQPTPVDATPAPSAPLKETPPAHVVGRPPENAPSAYAIPPQPTVDDDEALVEELAEMAMQQQHDIPASIPRLPSTEEETAPPAADEAPVAAKAPAGPRAPSEVTRRVAQGAVSFIQAWRRLGEKVGAGLRKFLPRLLPEGESADSSGALPTAAQIFIAVAVPLIVAALAFVVYSRLGRTAQYDTYLGQALALRDQALRETDLVRQREAWSNALQRVDQAEAYGGETPETSALREDAQMRLDELLGVTRLAFLPAFNAKLDADVSRMAANESELYMLDAVRGRILRAVITPNRGAQLDDSFTCGPDETGETGVGPLVDLLIPPKLNFLNATVIGVDAAGHLLYCAPGLVAIPQTLPAPNATWERATAMTFDGNKLYVLDASSRAVWVYNSKENTITFPDEPYFFFNEQIPELRDAIDIAVSGDQLYLLHADGRLTHCAFSRVETAPTRCDSPVPLINPFPAYGDLNAFTDAHFTQLTLAAPPETALLLLDADGRTVFSVGLQTFDLQRILGMAGGAINLSSGPFSAMAVSPNHVIYLAVGSQVFYSAETP